MFRMPCDADPMWPNSWQTLVMFATFYFKASFKFVMPTDVEASAAQWAPKAETKSAIVNVLTSSFDRHSSSAIRGLIARMHEQYIIMRTAAFNRYRNA